MRTDHRRRLAGIGLLLAILGLGTAAGPTPAVGAAVVQDQDGPPSLSEAQLDHVRTMAEGIAREIAGLDRSEQERILRQYVRNEFAVALGVSGADTQALGSDLDRQADELVNSILGGGPTPAPGPPPQPPGPSPTPAPPPMPAPSPTPAPAPSPRPAPRPAPRPVVYVVVEPEPVLYYYYVVSAPAVGYVAWPVVSPVSAYGYLPQQPVAYPVQSATVPMYWIIAR